MSLFQDKRICQDVNFYEIKVFPQTPGAAADGKVTIASASTQVKGVPDQEWCITTSSADGSLRVSGQAGGPSPAVDAMDISPDGAVTFPSKSPILINGPLKLSSGPAYNGVSSASLALQSGNANSQYYTLYAQSGGSTDGHLQLYSYNSPTSFAAAAVLDVAPQTPTAPVSINLSGNVNVAGSFTVNGQAPGEGGSSLVSKQFAVGSQPDINIAASSPGTVYAFDLTGVSGKGTYTVTIDRLQIGQLTTPSSSPVVLIFYLADSSGAAYTPAKACLTYPSPGVTNGNSAAMGPMTFVYSGSTPPGGLFLVAAQQGGTYGCILKGVTFNAAIVAA